MADKGVNRSRGENDLFRFVKTIYSGKIVRNYKDHYELDLFLPELNLAIEYNGIYWHSNKFSKDDRFIKKLKYFKDKYIQIINIYEDEWRQKKKIVKQKLSHILGTHERKIYARNCELFDISIGEKNIFLDNHHLEGKDGAELRICLKHKGKIVAFMSMNRQNTRSDYAVCKISRFATNCCVPGAFSKMLNYFIEAYNIESVIGYIDNRFSSETNNVFIKNGFTFLSKIEPRFYYIYNDKRFEKPPKHKRLDCLKIWDCGHVVYKKITRVS